MKTADGLGLEMGWGFNGVRCRIRVTFKAGFYLARGNYKNKRYETNDKYHFDEVIFAYSFFHPFSFIPFSGHVHNNHHQQQLNVIALNRRPPYI